MNVLDVWTLTVLFSACIESKSCSIGTALIHEAMKVAAGDDDSTINSKEANSNIVRDGKWALGAAHIEKEFNIECWGLVEGGA